jgi:hypothetical protein
VNAGLDDHRHGARAKLLWKTPFKALLDSRLVRCRVANGGVALEPNGDAQKRFVYATSEQPRRRSGNLV